MPYGRKPEASQTITFSAVEAIEEAARNYGWNIDYHQMSAGSFSASLAMLESPEVHLASNRFHKHIHFRCEPPEGCLALYLPCPADGRVTAIGYPVGEGGLVFLPPGAELRGELDGEVLNKTLFLKTDDFHAACRGLAPSYDLSAARSTRIFRGDPGRLDAIARMMDTAAMDGRLGEEKASEILAAIVVWMENTASDSAEKPLIPGGASALARKLQTYIEDNLQGPIRMMDLCAEVGLGVRTLQRVFSSHFQMTPTRYIFARRMNRARRDLAEADHSSSTVTAAATKNGFFHFGRFSVGYRSFFGESPRVTLRRRNGALTA